MFWIESKLESRTGMVFNSGNRAQFREDAPPSYSYKETAVYSERTVTDVDKYIQMEQMRTDRKSEYEQTNRQINRLVMLNYIINN